MEEETILETDLALSCFSHCFMLQFGKDASAGQAWAVIDADTGRLLIGSNENVRLRLLA